MASISQAAGVRTLSPPVYRRHEALVWFGWIAVPSWLVSLAFHVALMVVAAYSIHRPGGFGNPGAPEGFDGIFAQQWGGAAGLLGDGTGQPTGSGVGIHLGPAENAASDPAGDRTGEAERESDVSPSPRKLAASGQDADEAPPVELDLPAGPKIARMGPGPGTFGNSPTDARDMIRAKGRAGSGSGGAAGTTG